MARIKGPKKTNRYPDDFKIKAVQHKNKGCKNSSESIKMLSNPKK